MDMQPYPLCIVWDETDGDHRQSWDAAVIGWRELPDPDSWSEPAASIGPFPVVIHPDTQLPVTLGHDGPASVSRMWTTTDPTLAAGWCTRRRDDHGGRR